jgi:hypothetical protein
LWSAAISKIEVVDTIPAAPTAALARRLLVFGPSRRGVSVTIQIQT